MLRFRAVAFLAGVAGGRKQILAKDFEALTSACEIALDGIEKTVRARPETC